MRGVPFSLLIIAYLCVVSCGSANKDDQLEKIQLSNAEINYSRKGKGDIIILIHGSLADLNYWKNQNGFLEESFEVITYSRRYNYPNVNQFGLSHSALIEAGDLLELMDSLRIAKAHIIGHSYGAYTALLFAIEHPGRIKRLILAEPPLIRWLPEIQGGEGIFENFMTNVWHPMGEAFIEHGDYGGLEFTSRWYFDAPFDSISDEWKKYFVQNVNEWKALTTSADAFPYVNMESVQNIEIETLLLSGALNAGNMNDLIDGKLATLLPNNKRIIIPKAGHEMFIDNIDDTNVAIKTFLKGE
jgi:non-heme chloroperoxidase